MYFIKRNIAIIGFILYMLVVGIGLSTSYATNNFLMAWTSVVCGFFILNIVELVEEKCTT